MYLCRSRHEGFFIRHDRQDPGEFTPFIMHTHTTAEIFYFISGKAVYHVEGSTYSLQPGDLLIMRPGEAHYVKQDDQAPYERICLNFEVDLLSGLDPENTVLHPFYDREAGKRNLYRTVNTPDDICRTYLDNILDSPNDRLKALANLMLLLQQIGTMFKRADTAQKQPDTIENQIIRYINQNLEKALSIRELCDKFFISRAQLCRRFRNATGTSVGKYVTAKRLLMAQNKIRQGLKPTEVFATCGYQDYSTFYRAYVQYFGHSPRDARQIVMAEDERVEIG